MTFDLDEIGGPALVVAPHPDDETLGCGGLLASLTRRGVLVHTVFVTDGGASHRNSDAWERPRLAALREDEASAALVELGAGHQPRSFMRLLDADMPAAGSVEYARALGQATGIIQGLQPSHVILPWRRDPHRDHRDAWDLFTIAIQDSGQPVEVLEYTIWLEELGAAGDFPLEGEVERLELDVAEHLETKQRAILEHRSQLGELITDDPEGFYLTRETLDRLLKPTEIYWRSWPEQ